MKTQIVLSTSKIAISGDCDLRGMLVPLAPICGSEDGGSVGRVRCAAHFKHRQVRALQTYFLEKGAPRAAFGRLGDYGELLSPQGTAKICARQSSAAREPAS